MILFCSFWTMSVSFLDVVSPKSNCRTECFLNNNNHGKLGVSRTLSFHHLPHEMILQRSRDSRQFTPFPLCSTSSNLKTDSEQDTTSAESHHIPVPPTTAEEEDTGVSNETEDVVLQVGDRLPIDATFQILKNGKPTDILAADIFVGKKIILIGVPGAFTPTCTNKHIPPYLEKAQEFRDQKGIDQIIIVSVNDCFVMDQWRQELGIEEYKDKKEKEEEEETDAKENDMVETEMEVEEEESSRTESKDGKIEILVLADGGGNFARKTGFFFDTGRFGGTRMQRMSAVIMDGVVKMLHLEGGGKLEDSAAEVLMTEL